jgi:hypothetical protein
MTFKLTFNMTITQSLQSFQSLNHSNVEMINNNHFQSIIVIRRFHVFFIPLKSYNKAKSKGNNVI